MPKFSRIAIVYNPFAGGFRGANAQRLARVEEILRAAGSAVTSIRTTGPNTAGAIAARCREAGFDLVVAAGGDGTINEVVDGMVNSLTPMAILPAGTANVLANELGMGSGLRKAARRLSELTARRISLGRLEQPPSKPRHFLMMAGVGLDASIVYHLNLPLKARFGKVAYWLGGFSQVGRTLEEFQVSVDGQPHVCTFALISKVRNYGGDFEICRTVSLLDDRFEVVLFEGRNSLRYVKYLVGMMARRVGGMAGVSVLRGREISMAPSDGDRVFMQVDGELAGQIPARISMVPEALTLLMPPGYGCAG